MTHAQWWHEFLSIRAKEKKEADERMQLVNEVYKASARTFRETLVFLLGTNIGAGKRKSEDDPQPFIPLVTYVARPEVMKELLERETEETQATDILEDSGIESVVDVIESLDMGDLEPLLFSGKNSDDPEERRRDPEYQQMLRDMGISLYDSSLGETSEDAK